MSFSWSRNGSLRVATKRSGPCGCRAPCGGRRSFTTMLLTHGKSTFTRHPLHFFSNFSAENERNAEERRPPQGARQPQGPLRFVATRSTSSTPGGKLYNAYVDAYWCRLSVHRLASAGELPTNVPLSAPCPLQVIASTEDVVRVRASWVSP